MIVTQTTGAIKYSVSDSVEGKGTIVNRKKLLVHVWSVCEKLAINTKNPESLAVQINRYNSILYFDENLTKIEAVVMYGMCTCYRSEGIWDTPIII